MQISQEELAESREMLSRIESVARSRKRGRWLAAAAGLVFLVLGIWGLVVVLLADSYVSASIAAMPAVTPAVLSAGMDHLKTYFMQMILFLAALVTGVMTLVSVLAHWQPRRSDAMFIRLVRRYIAEAEADAP